VHHNIERHILPYFDYTEKKHTSTTIILNQKPHHGFGTHGLTTTISGHGVITHAQLGQDGALVAIAVVVVVVVVVITKKKNTVIIILKTRRYTLLTIGTSIWIRTSANITSRC
jgi:hypothetical protein